MLSCMVLLLLTSKAETASSGGSIGSSFNKALARVAYLPKYDNRIKTSESAVISFKLTEFMAATIISFGED